MRLLAALAVALAFPAGATAYSVPVPPTVNAVYQDSLQNGS